MQTRKVQNGKGRRKPAVAIATVAAIALAGASFGAAAANAATPPTSATPDLSKISTWTEADGYDFQGTTLPGSKTKALRISNAVDDVNKYGGITQLDSPAIAATGPRGTSSADYDTFTTKFTLSAKTYATQPDLAVEVSTDSNGNRAGGDLLLREEAGGMLTLTNFSAVADTDANQWTYKTAEVPFSKPIAIKMVSHFNADDSKDTVAVYLNGSSTPLFTGSTFETYADSQETPAETANQVLFRAVDRQVDTTEGLDVPWTSVVPSSDEMTALRGNGFYFSGLTYAASNTDPVSQMEFAIPTVSDTNPTVGEQLTAGTDTDDITGVDFKYQWLRNGAAISKATGATYTVTSSDYKKKLSVKVTASKPGYTTSTRTSASTAAVGLGTIVVTTPAAISGNASVGSKLSASISTTPKATYTYQWLADNVAISKATSSTYTVAVGDIGKKISVVINAKGTDLISPDASTSDQTDAVVAGTLTISTPKISGTAKVGKTLTASATATSGTLLRYAFYAGDTLVQLSTSPKLLLTYDLAGSAITVQVSGVKVGYTPLTTPSSAATAVVS